MLRDESDCRKCVLRTKCRDVDFAKPLKECIDFKHIYAFITLKVFPGESVWIAIKRNGLTVVEERQCTAIHINDKRDVTYQCEDIRLVDEDFGFKAFKSLKTAEIVLDLKTDWHV